LAASRVFILLTARFATPAEGNAAMRQISSVRPARLSLRLGAQAKPAKVTIRLHSG